MPMPVVRQGPAPDGNRKCGIQPAHQSRSTDVQRSRLLPCTATSTFGSSHAGRAGWTNATFALEKADEGNPEPLLHGHSGRSSTLMVKPLPAQHVFSAAAIPSGERLFWQIMNWRPAEKPGRPFLEGNSAQRCAFLACRDLLPCRTAAGRRARKHIARWRPAD